MRPPSRDAGSWGFDAVISNLGLSLHEPFITERIHPKLISADRAETDSSKSSRLVSAR